MTFADLGALCDYWERLPPAHVSVASYLQIKPAAKPARSILGNAEGEPRASDATRAEIESQFGPVRKKFRPPVPIQGQP